MALIPQQFKSGIDGTPESVEIASTEKIPLGFDFTANLGAGETLANYASQMTDLSINAPVSVSAPTLSGANANILLQEVLGSALIGGHWYRVVVSADAVGVVAGKRLSISVLVYCPF